MKFNVIASGSKGNATLITYKNTLILIDMGVSLTTLNNGLQAINKSMEDIDLSIFTHEHSDHIKGIKYLKSKTLAALPGTLPMDCKLLKVGEKVQCKDLFITPVKTSHDATNPCGYIIEGGTQKLVYITDTGYIPDETLEACENPTYLILESNHDIKMLMSSNRSAQLKRRIMGDYGHLCNEDSALYASQMIGPKTEEIVLAHLSEECNTPEKAIDAYQRVFRYKKIDEDQFYLRCAKQYEMTFGGHDEN